MSSVCTFNFDLRRENIIFTLLFDLLWMAMVMVMMLECCVNIYADVANQDYAYNSPFNCDCDEVFFIFIIDLPAFPNLRMKVTSSGQRYSGGRGRRVDS